MFKIQRKFVESCLLILLLLTLFILASLSAKAQETTNPQVVHLKVGRKATICFETTKQLPTGSRHCGCWLEGEIDL